MAKKKNKTKKTNMDETFRIWLETYRYGVYNGVEITPSSQLVRYTYVMSSGAFTHRYKTRYYFVEAEKKKARRARRRCNLCNFTIGLLGIPWGPIFAIADTIGNYIEPESIPWGSIAGPVNGTPQQEPGSFRT